MKAETHSETSSLSTLAWALMRGSYAYAICTEIACTGPIMLAIGERQKIIFAPGSGQSKT